MFGALSSRFRRKQPPPSRAAALERLKGLVGSGNRSGSLPRGGSDRRRKRKPIPQPDRPLRAGEILEQAEDGTVSPAPGFSRERARQQTQKPLAALFHLPYGGGDWPERIAGVARNTEAVVWAMVELLPSADTQMESGGPSTWPARIIQRCGEATCWQLRTHPGDSERVIGGASENRLHEDQDGYRVESLEQELNHRGARPRPTPPRATSPRARACTWPPIRLRG